MQYSTAPSEVSMDFGIGPPFIEEDNVVFPFMALPREIRLDILARVCFVPKPDYPEFQSATLPPDDPDSYYSTFRVRHNYLQALFRQSYVLRDNVRAAQGSKDSTFQEDVCFILDRFIGIVAKDLPDFVDKELARTCQDYEEETRRHVRYRFRYGPRTLQYEMRYHSHNRRLQELMYVIERLYFCWCDVPHQDKARCFDLAEIEQGGQREFCP